MKQQKYPLIMRGIHWLMALIILSLIVVGWWMADLPKEAEYRFTVYNLHKSFGVLILMLVTVRALTRIKFHKTLPKLPKGIPAHEQLMARLAHAALYIFMFAVPLLGYAMSNGAGYPVSFFGIEMPSIFPKNKAIGAFSHTWHAYMAYTLLAIIVLHAAGALKHRFFDKKENDVIGRML